MKDYALQAKKYCKTAFMINSISNQPVSYGGAFQLENGRLEKSSAFGKEDILILTID